jgi:pyridoxamine 5'-phosphate oxidase
MTSIADIRREYQLQTLSEEDLAADPLEQFGRWWEDAVRSEIDEVNAMTLATASPNGRPSARIVLLKEFTTDGFVFFTNYESHKGRELAENPQACLVFFWKELERQVRISGPVEKISAGASDAYFLSRPAESRLGAWASPQSRVIASRTQVEQALLRYQKQFGEETITRPPHWGGYVVRPETVEFWQGRPNRLHDRFLYTPVDGTGWKVERLAP